MPRCVVEVVVVGDPSIGASSFLATLGVIAASPELSSQSADNVLVGEETNP